MRTIWAGNDYYYHYYYPKTGKRTKNVDITFNHSIRYKVKAELVHFDENGDGRVIKYIYEKYLFHTYNSNLSFNESRIIMEKKVHFKLHKVKKHSETIAVTGLDLGL